MFGGFNLGGWIGGKDQISAGNIIAIVSTLLWLRLLLVVVVGGLLGTVMFVDIGALLNPTLTFEDPILSTHWPPSHNPLWFCAIIRVSVVY